MSDAASSFTQDSPSDAGESTVDDSTKTNDAAVTPAPAGPGSPLCGLVAGKCTPDEDGVHPVRNQTLCLHEPATSTTDAAADNAPTADASTATTACRVDANGSGTGPDCTTANSRGVDGVVCATGDDCAPGFDCVYAQKGTVCRRYCCSGTCDGVTSQNGGPTFCDVQPALHPKDQPFAPVCMPIKSCTLLKDGDCLDSETCAVVNSLGATSCVGRGNANVGDRCENEHCAVGLTCLGSPGDRTCYKLCRTTGGTECAANETCTTGSSFQDTTYGVCKTAAQ